MTTACCPSANAMSPCSWWFPGRRTWSLILRSCIFCADAVGCLLIATCLTLRISTICLAASRLRILEVLFNYMLAFRAFSLLNCILFARYNPILKFLFCWLANCCSNALYLCRVFILLKSILLACQICRSECIILCGVVIL